MEQQRKMDERMDQDDNDYNDNDNNEDSGSESDDSSSEIGVNERDVEAERLWKEQPFDFDVGLAHMQLLRARYASQELHAVRVEMHKRFALTPDLWKAWVEDAMRTAMTGKDKQDVLQLYGWALDDYLGIHGKMEVWNPADTRVRIASDLLQDCAAFIRQEYQLSMELDENAASERTFASAKEARAAWKSLCARVQMDISKCHLVYHPWIEWEIEQEKAVSDSKKKKQQHAEVEALFCQLLALPHESHAKSWQMYTGWIGGEEAEKRRESTGFASAATLYASLLEPYERILAQSEFSLEGFEDYLRYLNQQPELQAYKFGVMERMLETHFLNVEAWKVALAFAGGCELEYVRRATRNVTWSLDMWTRRLETEECVGTPLNELIALYESALLASSKFIPSDMEAFIAVLLQRCDFELRHIRSTLTTKPKRGSPKKTPVKVLASNFVELVMRHVEKLATYFPAGDPYFRLQRYVIQVLALDFDVEIARSHWKNLLSEPACRPYVDFWIERINFEVLFNKDKCVVALADLVRECVDESLLRSMDWPEKLLDTYFRLVRERGTVQDVYAARSLLEPLRKVVTQRRLSESQQYQEQQEQQPVVEYRKPYQREKKEASKNKQKQKRPRSEKEQDGKKEKAKKVRLEKEAPEMKDGTNGPEEATTTSKYRETDMGKVPCTIFVSNLSTKVTESLLRETFTGCGGSISDIRIVRTDRDGKVNCYAYIEFSHPGAVEEALKKDRDTLAIPGETTTPRTMFVSRFQKKKPKAIVEKQQAVNQKIVFVAKFPETVTQEQLKDLFSQFGNVKDVRLKHNKDKKPFAFIEFSSEESARESCSLHGTEFHGSNLSVNIARESAPAHVDLKKSLGGVQTKTAGGRTLALGLAPRTPAVQSTGGQILEGNPPPKSNADFRAMLFGKK